MDIKDYNVMIDGRNFFVQSMKNDLKTYYTIRKIATGQGDDYKIRSLLDYFKKYYKLITIDLSKQRKLDVDPKSIKQINFTGNLTTAEGSRMYFFIEEEKEIVLVFQKEKLNYYEFIYV